MKWTKMKTLKDWEEENKPSEDLIYINSFNNQLNFIKNELSLIFKHRPIVISQHRSKSICLPVIEFTLWNGTTITMRDNFYDWKVSVYSENEIICDIIDNEKIPSVYCEGFPEDKVYDSYLNNKKCFTISISSNEKLLEFCHVLINMSK